MKKTFATLSIIALALLSTVVAPSAALATGTVSGTITNSSAVGIPGAVLEFRQGGSVNYYYPAADGTYSVTPPAGTFKVYIHAPGYSPEYYNDSWSITGAQDVVVTEGGSLTLNASLAAPSTISGNITDYNAAGVLAQVFAYRVDDPTGDPVRGLTNAVTGAYSIDDLPPGDYAVFVSTDDTDDLVDQWYNSVYVQANATAVTIPAPGSSIPLSIQLLEGGAVVGSVTNTIGTPIDRRVTVTGDNGSTGTGRPLLDGSYVVDGVAPGNAVASITDPSGFFAPAASGPLAISTASTPTANFVLTPSLVDESNFYPFPAISGPTTVQAGKTYSWNVNVSNDGDVYAILYSNPVYLGAFHQDSLGVATMTVTIPASTTLGAHKLTYSSYDGQHGASRPYFDITVTAAEGPGGATSLSSTGVDASLPLTMAGMLIALGMAFLVRRRLHTH